MTTHHSTPSERLALSRERIRHALPRPSNQTSAHFSAGSTHEGVNIFDLLKLVLPAASSVIDAIAHWWAGRTGQSANALAGHMANEVLRPLAKRNPVALVAGAAAVGALLIWIRPWRWLFRPKLLSSLGPVVMSSVLASGVVQSWLKNFIEKLATPAPHPGPQTATHSSGYYGPGSPAGAPPGYGPDQHPNA